MDDELDEVAWRNILRTHCRGGNCRSTWNGQRNIRDRLNLAQEDWQDSLRFLIVGWALSLKRKDGFEVVDLRSRLLLL